MSNIYEERVMMIAAGDLQEFVPFGRDHCKHHPNALNLQLRQLQPASELWSSDGAAGLVGSLQEVTIHEKHKESWQLRKGISDVGEEVEYDEELYVAGNMVIWSRGSKSQASAVYKAFTVDSPVLQALWCDFSIPKDKSDKTEDSTEVVEKCICILQSSCINIHSIEGKDHIASLPFQVANVWPTKYGLLFERSSSLHEVPLSPAREPLPTMFSMLHPLDEITPMVCKSAAGLFGSARVQYVADYSMRIVFLNAEPSILMTYDATQSVHTIWALRRVKAEEQSAVLKFSEQVGTPQYAAASSSFTVHLRSLSKGDSPVASPFQNYSSIHSQSRSASSPSIHSRSPSISNMAALSRSHSPALGVHSFSGVQRFNFSNHAQSPRRHSACHSPNSAMDSFFAPETELIVPELCIDHLWTEAFTTTREKNSQASKVFITTDLCGQKFLCYLVESQLQLRCVKFQQSNDMSQLIFGSVTNIPAKDAAPVESIDTMLVLESNGNLVLYTGVVRVGKVFIPGLPAPSLTMSNQMPRPSTPLDNANTPSKPLNKHLGPLDEGVLSPVPELRDSSKLQNSSYIDDCTFQQLSTFIHSVRDPVQNRVTLELSSGSMVRITIPEIATSELVKRCLQGIKCILPREVAVQMLVRWYNAYNAPGGPSYYSEWNLFVTCLMNMMGYNTDRVAWTRNLDFEGSLSPVIAPKKARPSETGSDEDWEYLLNSDYHKNVESHPLAKALRLDPLEVKSPRDSLS
uniref:anaphase-promoting complex subunit 1-like n=1 Tax=Podarcis muralis TaxID=64176 RepID=UPI00109F0F2A